MMNLHLGPLRHQMSTLHLHVKSTIILAKKLLNVFPDGLDILMMLGCGSTVPCLMELLISATAMTGD